MWSRKMLSAVGRGPPVHCRNLLGRLVPRQGLAGTACVFTQLWVLGVPKRLCWAGLLGQVQTGAGWTTAGPLAGVQGVGESQVEVGHPNTVADLA